MPPDSFVRGPTYIRQSQSKASSPGDELTRSLESTSSPSRWDQGVNGRDRQVDEAAHGEQEHLLSHVVDMTHMADLSPNRRDGEGQPNVDTRYQDQGEELSRGAPSGQSEQDGILAPTGESPIEYKVYKRRWFGLMQLVLLNIVVSWDVSISMHWTLSMTTTKFTSVAFLLRRCQHRRNVLLHHPLNNKLALQLLPLRLRPRRSLHPLRSPHRWPPPLTHLLLSPHPPGKLDSLRRHPDVPSFLPAHDVRSNPHRPRPALRPRRAHPLLRPLVLPSWPRLRYRYRLPCESFRRRSGSADQPVLVPNGPSAHAS